MAYSFIYVTYVCFYKQHVEIAGRASGSGKKITNLKTAISLTGVLRLRKYRACQYVGRLYSCDVLVFYCQKSGGNESQS